MAGRDSSHLQAGLEGEAHLLPDEIVRLVEDVPPLAVAEDDPVGPAVLDHGGGQLPSEGSLLCLVTVLCGHTDGTAGELGSHVLEVTPGHSHHNLRHTGG